MRADGMGTARRDPWARASAIAGVVMILGGCGAAPRQFIPSTPPLAGHPRVALLPLENLSGTPDAGEVLTRIFFVELVRTGTCEVVETGEVEAALVEVRIRNTGALTAEQLGQLGERLRVDLVMTGSVLESGTFNTPDGQLPSVGVTLKLLDPATARVVWAGMHFRTGEDRETVFGWGRRRDPEKLAAELASEILRDFPRLAGHGERGRK